MVTKIHVEHRAKAIVLKDDQWLQLPLRCGAEHAVSVGESRAEQSEVARTAPVERKTWSPYQPAKPAKIAVATVDTNSEMFVPCEARVEMDTQNS